MRWHYTLLVAVMLCTTACGNRADTKNVAATLTPVSILDSNGTQNLVHMLNAYYKLKDALVKDNATAADAGTRKLMQQAAIVVEQMQTDSNTMITILTLCDTLKTGTTGILSVKNGDCETKRLYFDIVSDAVYGIVKKVELQQAGVYRQYCPMAFNDKGAYWLSNKTDIQNPYFGRKMPECGEITESF